jgi:5-methylcytosine-specific restriction endonuclease McrA
LKTCTECGVEKDLSEFYAASRGSGKRMSKCKSCVKARAREYRRTHREQCAQHDKARADLPHRVEARRKYQEEHKAQISEYKKKWSEDNSERVLAYRRDYARSNRAEVISRSKKWAEDNLEKVKAAKANNRRKRRAAKHAGGGTFTVIEFEKLCEGYGHRCLCCGDTEAVLEADHVLPLTKGGSGDISNIQPLCGSCNRKKFVSIVDYRTGEDTPSRVVLS